MRLHGKPKLVDLAAAMELVAKESEAAFREGQVKKTGLAEKL